MPIGGERSRLNQIQIIDLRSGEREREMSEPSFLLVWKTPATNLFLFFNLPPLNAQACILSVRNSLVSGCKAFRKV